MDPRNGLLAALAATLLLGCGPEEIHLELAVESDLSGIMVATLIDEMANDATCEVDWPGSESEREVMEALLAEGALSFELGTRLVDVTAVELPGQRCRTTFHAKFDSLAALLVAMAADSPVEIRRTESRLFASLPGGSGRLGSFTSLSLTYPGPVIGTNAAEQERADGRFRWTAGDLEARGLELEFVVQEPN
ncbi:MAG: hypothetical protein JRH01_21325 [Deltaproteobacteria bacterium]|nr:hypothetical protein [Deltaproteobacteria bacterium]MBW2396002.1 hypothetical protein [Deltaproteobacteria bacterium]